MASSPYSTRHRYGWSSVTAVGVSYVLTILVLIRVVSGAGAASSAFHWSLLVTLHLALAAILMLGHVWLNALASGFRLHITALQGILLGMLVDLLLLHGLRLGYGIPDDGGFEWVLLFVAAVSMLTLTVSSNIDSLLRLQRERAGQEVDMLTGLLNRQGLTRWYAQLPAAAETTVVMIDLNDFKAINDLQGHNAGDERLKLISQALVQQLPRAAVIGRWGGDEFLAVLPGPTDPAQALDAALAALVPQEGLPAFASGAVTVPASTPLNRAVTLADQQMYENKAELYDARDQQRRRPVGLPEFPLFLLGLMSPEETIERGLARGAELAGFPQWFHADLQSRRLTCRAQVGGASEQHDLGDLGNEVARGGIIAQSAARQQVLWAADYERSPFSQPDWTARGLKSVVAAPVVLDGRTLAVVGFLSCHQWHSVTPQARHLLELTAVHLSYQLRSGAVLTALRHSVEAGVTGMGVLLEARDLETAGHTQRVVQRAHEFGLAAGLTGEALQALRLGAYLHDVGKLAIPDRVLLKPGPLDASERAVMQTHSELGARMVTKLPSLPPGVAEVVRSHHERWDGTGYPQGLAGQGIPLLARLFSICDVYDALISARPYKRAWSAQEARDELLRQAGAQFDPQLTALFVDQMLPRAGPEDGGVGVPGGPDLAAAS